MPTNKNKATKATDTTDETAVAATTASVDALLLDGASTTGPAALDDAAAVATESTAAAVMKEPAEAVVATAEMADHAETAAVPEDLPASYNYHPAALMYPRVLGPEFDDIVADIKTHGQQQPIVRHKGQILDGITRLRACAKLGIKARFEERDDIESPVAYVRSANGMRRHLTAAQKAAVAAEMADLLAVEARERQRRAGSRGKEGGRGHKKLKETLGGGAPPRGADEKKSTVRAAKSIGAGTKSTKRMKAVKTKAPEVHAATKAGTIKSVANAERIANLPPSERAKAIANGEATVQPSSKSRARKDTGARQTQEVTRILSTRAKGTLRLRDLHPSVSASALLQALGEEDEAALKGTQGRAIKKLAVDIRAAKKVPKPMEEMTTDEILAEVGLDVGGP